MCGKQCQHWHNCQIVCPYRGCTVGANESMGLAVPIKVSGGRGVLSTVANAPVSPVSLILLGLDEGEGALPVVGTTPAMPRALPVSGLLVGLIKPPLQHPRCWGLGCMVEQGVQVQQATAWRGLA